MRRSMQSALIVGALVAAGLLPPAVGAQEAPDGREVYLANCASCHQGTGVGVPGSFPPLLDNPNIQDAGYVGTVIREGLTGPIEVNGVTYDSEMPAQAQLTDAEIDALAVDHDAMVAAWQSGDEAGYFSHNRRIHEGIMAASRNVILANIYESLSGRIQRSRYSAHQTPDQ